MLQIPSVRLNAATVLYSSQTTKTIDDNNGRWNLQKTKFLKGNVRSLNWLLITGPGVRSTGESVRALTEHFNQQVRVTGVSQSSQRLGDPLTLDNGKEETLDTTLRDYLSNSKSTVPDIVVLLLKQKDQRLYSSFKYLADCVYILQSICVTEEKMKPKKNGWNNGPALGQYLANVSMKANLKMAGINHSAQGVEKWLKNTIVIGADVTHPGSGSLQGSPSIAAIVSSLEANGGRFRGRLQLQNPKQEVSLIKHKSQASLTAANSTDH
jgi:eukaryotic translation initiation factor 2C